MPRSLVLRMGAMVLLITVLIFNGSAGTVIQGQSPTPTPTSGASQSPRSIHGTTGRITYVGTPEGGKYAGKSVLFMVDPDGKNRKILVCKTQEYINYESLAWSPDGKWLAFSWYNGNQDIYIMDAEGENLTRLTTDEAPEGSPAWSPDSTMIVFTSDRGDFRDLYIVGVDGKNERRLTDNGADNDFPAWSPDGQRIAFSSNWDGTWLLYTMDVSGHDMILLAESDTEQKEPAWSPDGSMIAYVSSSPGEVYVMNSDGSNVRKVTEGGGFNTNPIFSPDGKYLAFSRFGSIPNAKAGHSFAIMMADLETLTLAPLFSSASPMEQFTWSQ
ncbi:MAG: PD40 domain-containing protein [Anaerolinea sp.]|nr:PD40 domain-containing protein [Anaerolinea sp.]MCC6974988.1 PD40 domain-containing protein [Anaerolineae bacterium]CAG0960856.1 Tol-Pal system protein TolB [Anaerolineae bacterium]